MIYTNLLLFLVAIFLFSVDTIPETPMFSPVIALILFVASVVGFDRLCSYLYSRPSSYTSSGYFDSEKKLSVLALVFFGVGALYLCDVKYYLAFLSIGGRLPALINIAGLGVFLLYLALMWKGARRSYQHVFGKLYSSRAFILSNLKANLPIVLPWVMLSLCYDLLLLIPVVPLQEALASQWGDIIFFALFLCFVMLFFPPMVRRLWGCSPLPEGELKENLIRFCSKQDFSAGLYIWPLFEGRVLTAGVMGVVPGLRYILLTPAIIETMTMEELESVMAHEIGHVKRYHLLLYVLLIGGFSLFAAMLAEPFLLMLLSRAFFVDLITTGNIDPETLIAALGSVPLLIFMVFYFRFIFGYFIRNFERQADLHVLKVVGDGRALVSAFEKIARMSGNIRDQKNWHHFGIGERIDCIERAEYDTRVISGHDRKVRNSLLAYIFLLAAAFMLVREIPMDELSKSYEEKYAEAVIMKKAGQEPDKAIWQRMLGDLMLGKKHEKNALAAYEKAYNLDPTNPEIRNNLAWLLLTSEDLELRDPIRALALARGAAKMQPKGYILDTLATAYWANGFVKEALEVEKQAAFVDPDQLRLYRSRALGFAEESYEEGVARKRMEQAEQEEQ